MSEWVKCSERMPTDEGEYLTWSPEWRYGVSIFVMDGNCYWFEVSHWMPLPAPPEAV